MTISNRDATFAVNVMVQKLAEHLNYRVDPLAGSHAAMMVDIAKTLTGLADPPGQGAGMLTDHFTVERHAVWCIEGTERPRKGDKRIDKHYVEREVAVCQHCRRYDNDLKPERIPHDALCTYLLIDPAAEPKRLRGGEEQTLEVLRALFQRAGVLLGVDLSAAKGTVNAMGEYAPGTWPAGRTPAQMKAYGAEKVDEEAPLFSEAYLYPLFGKDEARTILAKWNAVRRAVGLTP